MTPLEIKKNNNNVKQLYFIDIAVPGDSRVASKENEKVQTY